MQVLFVITVWGEPECVIVRGDEHFDVILFVYLVLSSTNKFLPTKFINNNIQVKLK